MRELAGHIGSGTSVLAVIASVGLVAAVGATTVTHLPAPAVQPTQAVTSLSSQSLPIANQRLGETGLYRGPSGQALSSDRLNALFGAVGAPAEVTFDMLATSLRDKPKIEWLRQVNSFFNALPYVSDEANYARTDYWATPAEFLAHGGDCEDFALAKYHALIALGFPERDLRLVMVEDVSRGTAHAVLTARLKGQVFVLDNQTSQIRTDAETNAYQPLYALNSFGVWSFEAATTPLDRLQVTARGR